MAAEEQKTDGIPPEAVQKINKALQEKIKEIIDTKKVDISTIARGINKSPTTVSLYLSGRYKRRTDLLEKDLKNYLNVFEKREKTELKSLEFVETTVVKRVFNAANMCQLRGKMGVCFGSPGIGKTTAIKAHQKRSSGVIVIDPSEKISARTILINIAEQLKLPYSNNMCTDSIITAISKKVSKNNYLIIVDEAENINIDSFKVLRKIFDRSGCGLLFVGTEELQAMLLKVKYGFPYISSRIGYVEQLDALKIEDIEKLVLQYFPECEENIVKYIAKICRYNARTVQNLLDLCLDIIISNKVELTADVIETAKTDVNTALNSFINGCKNCLNKSVVLNQIIKTVCAVDGVYNFEPDESLETLEASKYIAYNGEIGTLTYERTDYQ